MRKKERKGKGGRKIEEYLANISGDEPAIIHKEAKLKPGGILKY